MKQSRYLFLYLFCTLFFSCIMSCKHDEQINFSSDKQLLTFKIDTILGQIDETNHTVTIIVPGKTDLTHVKPVIATSPKSTVSPASLAEVDLTNPVIYTITAEDLSQQTYKVIAKKAVNLQNRILSFSIKKGTETFNGIIDDSALTVKIGVPFTNGGQINIKKIATTVTIPTGATITPAINAEVDFSSPVVYKVTAPNGEIKEYTVSVLNNESKLFSFGVPLKGTEDQFMRPTLTTHSGQEYGLYPEEVTGLNLPYGIFHVLETENFSALTLETPTLSPGATISPAANAPQNFTNDVVYTVTSQFGTSTNYTIRAVKKKIIFSYELHPTSIMVDTDNGNILHYLSAQDIKEAWLVAPSTQTDYAVTVGTTTSNSWGYKETQIFANTTLPEGFYVLKVKLTNNTVVSDTHSFFQKN